MAQCKAGETKSFYGHGSGKKKEKENTNIVKEAEGKSHNQLHSS